MPLPLVSFDRVLESSTTAGTGPYTLGGAVTGYNPFSSIPGLEDGSPVALAVEGYDASGVLTGFETGTYTWNTGGTLTRTRIRTSSNNGDPVDWPATGTRRIGATLLANELQEFRGYKHDASGQFDTWKVSPALSRAKVKATRILLIGTSIANFNTSGIKIAAAQLQATYGRNGTRVFQCGVSGGSWSTVGDLKKQAYCSLPPVRAAFDTGVSRSWTGVVDGFNVVYGTEPGCGSLEIRIDGALVQTINCNATQSYGNVWRNTYTQSGSHTILLTATGASGTYVPVERVELRDDGPGFFIEDGTMGGVGLQHVVNQYTGDANNRAPAPLTAGSNIGIDSVFNRSPFTQADLIMQQHFTNDGAEAYPVMKRIMDRAADLTLAARTSFVVLTESPAMNFVTAQGTLSADRERLRTLLMSYGDRENVVGIDWIKFIDFSNPTAYEARYFPGGDKTHPTAEAYLPLYSVLADLFHMAHPALPNADRLPGALGPDAQRGRNPYAPDAYSNVALPVGVGRKDSSPFGGVVTSFARAAHAIDTTVFANVFLSDKAVNSSTASRIDAILNSTTVDRFGPYLPGSTSEMNIGMCRNVSSMVPATDTFTVLILARSCVPDARCEIRFFDGGSGRTPTLLLNGNVSPAPNASAVWYGDTQEPRYYYITIRRNDTIKAANYDVLTKCMDIYGMWAVEGSVPIVTSRDKDRARFVGVPAYMTGDYTLDKVAVGSTYLTVIPGKTIPMMKRATEGIVYKWGQEQKYARLYEIVNRADHPVLFMQPTGLNAAAVLTYDEAIGGEQYFHNGGQAVTGGTPALFVQLTAAVAGEQYTLAMRNSEAYDTGCLTLTNSGGGNKVYLQLDGTWATTRAEVAGGNDGTKYPMNVAVTFTMPASGSTIATNLGSTPRVVLEYIGPTYGVTPATLVRGPSACY